MLMRISRFVWAMMFLCLNLTPTSYVFAETIPLVSPIAVSVKDVSYTPTLIKGLTIHPKDPFQFDFLVYPSRQAESDRVDSDEAMRLIKYFLAGLTVPEKELWVNLSPGDVDRVMADGLSQTVMGRDLLAQDFMLKKISSALMASRR